MESDGIDRQAHQPDGEQKGETIKVRGLQEEVDGPNPGKMAVEERWTEQGTPSELCAPSTLGLGQQRWQTSHSLLDFALGAGTSQCAFPSIWLRFDAISEHNQYARLLGKALAATNILYFRRNILLFVPQ